MQDLPLKLWSNGKAMMVKMRHFKSSRHPY